MTRARSGPRGSETDDLGQPLSRSQIVILNVMLEESARALLDTPARAEHPQVSLMKLATWNVQRLTRITSVRMSRVRPYLDAINADIWVLTETGEDVSPARCGRRSGRVGPSSVWRPSLTPRDAWRRA